MIFSLTKNQSMRVFSFHHGNDGAFTPVPYLNAFGDALALQTDCFWDSIHHFHWIPCNPWSHRPHSCLWKSATLWLEPFLEPRNLVSVRFREYGTITRFWLHSVGLTVVDPVQYKWSSSSFAGSKKPSHFETLGWTKCSSGFRKRAVLGHKRVFIVKLVFDTFILENEWLLPLQQLATRLPHIT